jgi:hypothetical protein
LRPAAAGTRHLTREKVEFAALALAMLIVEQDGNPMIIQRIRREIPPDLCVIKETTPIVYFGNYTTATACTISLNPSSREFLDNSGSLLTGRMSRLCSRRELCRRDTDVLSVADSVSVIHACDVYFQNRPYRAWFNKVERFLKHYSYSYFNGSCVHLDLVQWATNPIWRYLSQSVKSELLEQDLSFLIHLLSKDFQHIFLNGETVVTELSKHIDFKLNVIEVMYNCKRMKIYSGDYQNARVIGWSAYLQSSRVPGYESVDQLAFTIKSRTKE